MQRLKPAHVAIWAIGLLVGLATACSSSDGNDGQAGAADGAGETQSGDIYSLKQQFPMSIDMSSTKFNETRRIPRDYSCERDDISPPIDWGNVPDGTVSLALLVDSDQVPGQPWAHWVLWGIPADATGLPEGVPGTPAAPSVGTKAGQGTNDDGKVGWSGPCPPPFTLAMPDEFRRPEAGATSAKSAKTYTFRLYALDTEISLGPDATKDDLLRAMDGHILAGGELVGEFVGKVVSLNPLG